MINYSAEQKREIKKLMKKEKNVVMHRKYQVIYLHMRGYSNKFIAKIVDLHEQTVGIYIKTYNDQGIKALIPKKSPGAPCFLTKEQESNLYEVISEKTPNEVGFDNNYNWTAKIACLYVKTEFDIDYSINGMLDLLHRLNLSWTRPTYVLAKADPEKQEEFEKEFKEVKKKLLNEDIDHILFEDESTIRDYQAIMNTWFPKGQQRIIKTYGKHYSVKLTGILNYDTGEVYVEESEEFNAQIFLGFLKNVLIKYPEGKIIMVLDNSRVHHAEMLREFLEKNKRLQLMFLPPYSPKLNVIEGLWGWLKDTCINNAFFSKAYQIKLAVRKFVSFVNTIPEIVIDRLCVRI